MANDKERKDEIRRIWREELEQTDELEITMPGGLDFQVRRSGHEPHETIERSHLDDQANDYSTPRLCAPGLGGS